MMPDLTSSNVRGLLSALGLEPVDAEDLEEITHRINALHESLAVLERPELDDCEPAFTFEAEDTLP